MRGWHRRPIAVVLGLLVLVNVQLDARRNRSGGRTKVRAAAAADWRIELGPGAVRGLRTAGTFTTIALLWSLWSSPSLAAWLDLLGRGLRGL